MSQYNHDQSTEDESQGLRDMDSRLAEIDKKRKRLAQIELKYKNTHNYLVSAKAK